MIDALAQVDERAQIDATATIMNHAYIGPYVTIGPGCVIKPFAVIEQHTHLGVHNIVHSHAVLGSDPQDISYQGQTTQLVVGDYNTFREGVTINRGSHKTTSAQTRIGNHNFFMAYSHVGHDCQVANHCIMTNYSGISGHVALDDHAILSGYVGAHQGCNIGAYAMVTHGALLPMDVMPYMLVVGGDDPRIAAVNKVGLKRHGFSAAAITDITSVYRRFVREKQPLAEVIDFLQSQDDHHGVFYTCLQAIKRSKRGLIR
jgi:UDP-N-acetylglucosamine acyltransferase